MFDVRVLAPLSLRNDAHVRDARLWKWVETQSVATIENIEVVTDQHGNKLVEILLMDYPRAGMLAKLLASFEEAF